MDRNKLKNGLRYPLKWGINIPCGQPIFAQAVGL